MISTMRENKGKKELFTFGSGILLVILLVHLLGLIRGDRLIFPGVGEISRAFVRLLSTGNTYIQIGITLLHTVEAMILSLLTGVAVGYTEGLIPWVHSLLRPLMMILRSMPMIVLVITIMVLCPYAWVPVIAACAVLVPLISEAVYEGCRRIEPEYLDVYRINSDVNARVLVHVYLPLTAGYLRQAFVNAAGMGLKVAVTAEYLVQTRNSLGKAIYTSSYFIEYSEIYAYALIMVLLILILTGIPETVMAMRRRLSPSS